MKYLAGHAAACWKVRKVHQFVSRYDMFFNLAFKMLRKETTKTEQIKIDDTIFQQLGLSAIRKDVTGESADFVCFQCDRSKSHSHSAGVLRVHIYWHRC